MKALTEAQVERYRNDGFLFPFPALNEAERANCLGGLERYERWLGTEGSELRELLDEVFRTLEHGLVAPPRV